MALSNRVPDMREEERQPPKPGRSIGGLVWALIALAVLIGIIVWVFKAPSRSTQPNGPTATQNQVKFSNLKVASVTSASGGNVLHGTAKNLTGEPLTAIYVTAGFTNNSGHVIAQVPETVTNAAGSPLASNPIPPGESHDVAITLNNPPQAWDGTAPVLTVTGVDHGNASGATGEPGTPGTAEGNNAAAQGQASGAADNTAGGTGGHTAAHPRPAAKPR